MWDENRFKSINVAAQHTARLVVGQTGGSVRNPHGYQQHYFHALAGGCNLAGNSITFLRYFYDVVRADRRHCRPGRGDTTARAFAARLAYHVTRAVRPLLHPRRIPGAALSPSGWGTRTCRRYSHPKSRL